MKVRKFHGREAGKKVLLTDEERAEAEARVRQQNPDAVEVNAHPDSRGIYAEVWRQENGRRVAGIVRVA